VLEADRFVFVLVFSFYSFTNRPIHSAQAVSGSGQNEFDCPAGPATALDSVGVGTAIAAGPLQTELTAARDRTDHAEQHGSP
jgi:hypothetical protein